MLPNDPSNSQFEDPNFNSILNTEDGHENTQLVISSQRHEDSRLLRRLEESLLSDERAKIHTEIKDHGRKKNSYIMYSSKKLNEIKNVYIYFI